MSSLSGRSNNKNIPKFPSDIGTAGQYVKLKTDVNDGFEYVDVVDFSLPKASSNTLGGVKINGNNLTIDGDGLLSATNTEYSEGDGININNNNVISLDLNNYSQSDRIKLTSTTNDVIFVATDTTKEVKLNIGSDTKLKIANDSATFSNTCKATNFIFNDDNDNEQNVRDLYNNALTSVPIATTEDVGGVVINGNNLTIDSTSGVLSATNTEYTAGTNISITNEVISATDTVYSQGSGINIATNNTISLDLNNYSQSDRIKMTSTTNDVVFVATDTTKEVKLNIGSDTKLKIGNDSATFSNTCKATNFIFNDDNDNEQNVRDLYDNALTSIPFATTSAVGGVIINGNNLRINSSTGVLSALIPAANNNTIGGVIITGNDNLQMSIEGVLSAIVDQKQTLLHVGIYNLQTSENLTSALDTRIRWTPAITNGTSGLLHNATDNLPQGSLFTCNDSDGGVYNLNVQLALTDGTNQGRSFHVIEMRTYINSSNHTSYGTTSRIYFIGSGYARMLADTNKCVYGGSIQITMQQNDQFEIVSTRKYITNTNNLLLNTGVEATRLTIDRVLITNNN